MSGVPESVRRLASAERVLLSEHAQEQLAADGLTFDDLLNSILCGALIKKERDETGVSRFKYVIVGPAVSGRKVYSCGKVIKAHDEQEYFVITAHEAF